MEPFVRNNVSSACDMNLKINFVTTVSCFRPLLLPYFSNYTHLFTNPLVSLSQVMFSNLRIISKFSWFFIGLIFGLQFSVIGMGTTHVSITTFEFHVN